MAITKNRILKKEITLGIIGLGYVGLPLAITFAETGIKVIGFDNDKEKTEQLIKGKCYLKHVNLNKIKKIINNQTLIPISDYNKIKECDALIICTPTPLDIHLEPDTSYIIKSTETIAKYIKKGTLVSLESTSWPGTTEELILPILQKNNRLELGKSLFLCFSPEREDPGNKKYNTKNIPKLIGATDPKSLELAISLYSLAIDHVIPVSSTKVAEMTKLYENIFRTVNIAFVNEMKIICDKMDIDIGEVINAASTKPFGFMPFWPGPGLGGQCLPINPYYLSWKAKEFGISTRFIELAGEINRLMPEYVVSKIQDCLNFIEKPLKNARILILGLSYKPNLDDIRESPSLEIMRLLEEKGALVDYHDPYIPKIPLTRKYKSLLGKKSKEITKNYDCFVLSTDHKIFDPTQILLLNKPIIDTRYFFPDNDLVFRA